MEQFDHNSAIDFQDPQNIKGFVTHENDRSGVISDNFKSIDFISDMDDYFSHNAVEIQSKNNHKN